MAVFKEMVTLGGGLMLGRRLFQFWQPQSLDTAVIRSTLQVENSIGTDSFRHLEARFREWYAWTFDLPGRFYLEAVERNLLEERACDGELHRARAEDRPRPCAGASFSPRRPR